jgi:hypothetical protein
MAYISTNRPLHRYLHHCFVQTLASFVWADGARLGKRTPDLLTWTISALYGCLLLAKLYRFSNADFSCLLSSLAPAFTGHSTVLVERQLTQPKSVPCVAH